GNISGIVFADQTFVYDGKEKALTYTGILPQGVTASYSNNSRTAVGSQLVTLTLDGGANYHSQILTANLNVTKADISNITLNDHSFVYDGSAKSLTYSGTLPEGVTAT